MCRRCFASRGDLYSSGPRSPARNGSSRPPVEGGRDGVTFTACSLTLPAGSNCGEASEALRCYTSFSAAAGENGLSRILVGFHFRTAVNVGIEHGRKIGDRAVDELLAPAH